MQRLNRLALLFLISTCGAFILTPTISAKERLDPNAILDELLDPHALPRLLLDSDIQPPVESNLSPLQYLSGDFNEDKKVDVVLSGVYELPPARKPYFLLVGTFNKKASRSETIYYEESASPFFLHAAGTTGLLDPGTQAFSVARCANCSSGNDYFWDAPEKTFVLRSWENRVLKTFTMKPVMNDQIPDPLVNEALQAVAQEPAVQTFIQSINKKKGKLGSRAQWKKTTPPQKKITVTLFETQKNKENIFGVFIYDIETKSTYQEEN